MGCKVSWNIWHVVELADISNPPEVTLGLAPGGTKCPSFGFKSRLADQIYLKDALNHEWGDERASLQRQ